MKKNKERHLLFIELISKKNFIIIENREKLLKNG